MDNLVARANDVLRHNAPIATNNITTRGSNWLWAVMAVMLVSMFVFVGLTIGAAKKRSPPRYHYIAIAITLVSAFAYFVMASNLGAHAVFVTYLRGGKRPGLTREIFYTRWIEYFITFSLEILALLTLARAAWSTKLFVIGATMFMIVCHLTGAFVRSKYKWGFLVFGLLGYLLVAWKMATNVRRSAQVGGEHEGKHSSMMSSHDQHHTTPLTGNNNTTGHHTAPVAGHNDTYNHSSHATNDGRVAKKYHTLTAYLLFLWVFYPICWGLSEAGNVLSLDSECIFYGILDILTKPVFCFLLIFLGKGADNDSHQSKRKSTSSTLGNNSTV